MSASQPKLRILIADDHAGMRRIVRRTCARLDCEFFECATGEAAIEAFETVSPDWVVMDVQMPGIGGMAATAAIRARHPHARVIVISQSGGAEFAEQARLAGACDFVNKENLARVATIIAAELPPG